MVATKHIHLIAVCGVGMAPLACMLKRAGYSVSGSDNAAFPPMSAVLADSGIKVLEGFDACHLSPPPDLVIVGNAVPRSNVEAVEAERLGLEMLSFPQALTKFFIGERDSLVVAGTHGKTTTTGMLATALVAAGENPGYLIGGLVRDLGDFASCGSGRYFVIEGDEYDCAYFDKRPKFIHYRPAAAIVTSIEFDHADIYRDLDHVKSAFASFARLLPAEGLVVGCGDCPSVAATMDGPSAARFVSYGFADGNDWQASSVETSSALTRFRVAWHGRDQAIVRLRLAGKMNVLNALATYALCRELGVDEARVRDALADYRGAARRQELLGEAAGVTVIDDFAHHPTAVEATLEAVRAMFPGRRLVAVFEPRSNTSRRAIFQSRYAAALTAADVAVVSGVYAKSNDPLSAEQVLSTERLVAELGRAGTEAWSANGPEAILQMLPPRLAHGDVVVCMSNGVFGNLPRRLLDALGGGAGSDLTVEP